MAECAGPVAQPNGQVALVTLMVWPAGDVPAKVRDDLHHQPWHGPVRRLPSPGSASVPGQ